MGYISEQSLRARAVKHHLAAKVPGWIQAYTRSSVGVTTEQLLYENNSFSTIHFFIFYDSHKKALDRFVLCLLSLDIESSCM